MTLDKFYLRSKDKPFMVNCVRFNHQTSLKHVRWKLPTSHFQLPTFEKYQAKGKTLKLPKNFKKIQ